MHNPPSGQCRYGTERYVSKDGHKDVDEKRITHPAARRSLLLGTGVRNRSLDGLVHLMSDRGGELPHGGDAIGVRHLHPHLADMRRSTCSTMKPASRASGRRSSPTMSRRSYWSEPCAWAAGPAPGDLLVHELQGRADGQVCQVPASPRGGRPPRRVEERATIATSCLKRWANTERDMPGGRAAQLPLHFRMRVTGVICSGMTSRSATAPVGLPFLLLNVPEYRDGGLDVACDRLSARDGN
jgi:hypothetical protein